MCHEGLNPFTSSNGCCQFESGTLRSWRCYRSRPVSHKDRDRIRFPAPLPPAGMQIGGSRESYMLVPKGRCGFKSHPADKPVAPVRFGAYRYWYVLRRAAVASLAHNQRINVRCKSSPEPPTRVTCPPALHEQRGAGSWLSRADQLTWRPLDHMVGHSERSPSGPCGHSDVRHPSARDR